MSAFPDRIFCGDVEEIGPNARPDTTAHFNAYRGISEGTPAALTDDIRAVLARYSEREPVQVDVHPYSGAEPFQCYANAAALAVRFGGVVLTGWSVWRHQTLPILTFVHHAVYGVQDGSLIDVSPPPNKERAITFLPDAEWGDRDTDPRKPGYTVPLVTNPLIVAACVLLNKREQIGIANTESDHLESEASWLLGAYERLVEQKEMRNRLKSKASCKHSASSGPELRTACRAGHLKLIASATQPERADT